MRVAFLVHDLGLSGGVGVVVEHARRLRARPRLRRPARARAPERTADWSVTAASATFPCARSSRRASERYDVVVATWWETVFVLHHLPAERYAYFVQTHGGALLRARATRRAWPPC